MLLGLRILAKVRMVYVLWLFEGKKCPSQMRRSFSHYPLRTSMNRLSMYREVSSGRKSKLVALTRVSALG